MILSILFYKSFDCTLFNCMISSKISMEVIMNTGQKIRDLRKKHGITQKALADKLGTSPQNLAQYESGKRHPKIETLQKIADALDIPVSDIIGTGFLNIPDDKIDYFAGKGGLVVQDPQEVHLN